MQADLCLQLLLILIPEIDFPVIVIQHQKIGQPQFLCDTEALVPGVYNRPMLIEIVHRVCPVVCCLLIKHDDILFPVPPPVLIPLLVLIINDEIGFPGISSTLQGMGRHHIICPAVRQYKNSEVISHDLTSLSSTSR